MEDRLPFLHSKSAFGTEGMERKGSEGKGREGKEGNDHDESIAQSSFFFIKLA
jgi:hypothetical protein